MKFVKSSLSVAVSIFLAILMVLMSGQSVFAYLVVDDGEPVHEYVVQQAMALYSAFYSHPEINAALNVIESGSGHEDVYDHVTDRSGLFTTITHFWDADKGDDDPVDMIIIGDNGINSWQKAQVLWGMALGEHAHGDYGAAYEYLGHVAHLLADMTVPAHAHEDSHPTETFEKDYMLFSNAQLTPDEKIGLIQKGLVQIPNSIDPLYYLFYTANQIGDYYPSDDYDGDTDTRGGWMDGVYAELGMYPISRPVDNPADCEIIRQYSYLYAIRSVATLYKLFYEVTSRHSALTVVIDRIQAQDAHEDPWWGADFFVDVFINGARFWNEGDQLVDQDDISPHWAFGRKVGFTGSVPVGIQVWDEDEDPNPDDQSDINPVDNMRDLNFTVNLDTGAISGDITGTCGTTLSIVGNEDDYSRIWFRVLLPVTTDLAITKSDNPDPVIAGNDLTYTVSVNNNGLSDATGVSVTDTLPNGVTFISADTHGKGTYDGGTGIWTVGSLANGESASMTLVVKVNSSTPAGNINNTATVTGAENDPDTTNNTANQQTSVQTRTDLAITKVDSPDPVIVATDLTYTIKTTNNGPSDATGIVVTDTLPAGVTFKSADTHGKGTYNSGTGVWGGLSGFNLASGETATLTLVVNINAPAVDLTVLTNKAEVTGNETDPDTTNNKASQDSTVYAPVIKVNKSDKLLDADGDGVAGPGDTIRYSAIISNSGNGPATGVIFTDTPDMNTPLVVGSVTTTLGFVSQGNIAGNIVEVNVGTVPAHSQVTITFDVKIANPLWENRVTNQATVKGATIVTLKSNDPDTGVADDPTVTLIKTSPPVHGPTMSEWGILALTTLLGGGMVWRMRRRQIRSDTINQ